MKSESQMLYDPPSGWMYGFPKLYVPKGTLEETLLADGYPKELIELALKHTRFWVLTTPPKSDIVL